MCVCILLSTESINEKYIPSKAQTIICLMMSFRLNSHKKKFIKNSYSVKAFSYNLESKKTSLFTWNLKLVEIGTLQSKLLKTIHKKT